MNNQFTPLKNYYVIGNLHTCALVSNKASIDWMCLPRFDSPAVFSRILDLNAGSFSVVQNDYQIEAGYVKDTAIVKFKFIKNGNEFYLKDFMVPGADKNTSNFFLVRKLTGKKGENNIELIFEPKGNFGELEPKITKDENSIKLELHRQTILIYLPNKSKIDIEKSVVKIFISLKEKEEKSIVMEYFDKAEKAVYKNEDLEKKTIDFWKGWVKVGNYFKYKHDLLVRAMITLRLLQYYPNGVLVAAPTCSIPAEIGGVRNWDYRYVWIRDVTFTLFAFNILNCEDELIHFFNFMYSIMDKQSTKDFDINTIYTINGEKGPKEKIIKNLSGYKNSKPVRLGNNGTTQFQMDKYGNLIDAHYFLMKKDKNFKMNREFVLRLADKICNSWMMRDSGIWEMRGEQRHYTYSKVMSWVGIDRIIRMRDYLNLNEKEITYFEKVRMKIKDWIWGNCYDKEKKIFVQYPGADYQDATNYLFVILQFLDKKDKLTKTIIENTSKELCEKDIFVYRYKVDDGIAGKDNSFLICTFWMISAWAILEEIDKAEHLYNLLLEKFAGHYLLSEQINSSNGEYTGNFPQAYSHLGITMTTYYINKYKQRKKNQPDSIK